MKAIKLAAIIMATAIGMTNVVAQDEMDVMQITFENGFATRHNVSEIEDMTIEKQSGTIGTVMVDGHECVDLGLPSGILWATCNVGGSQPTDLGDYFAWGETQQKTEFSIYNCPTYRFSTLELLENGIIDGSGNLTADYDTATVNWGSAWRMPTDNEVTELADYCTWEWIPVEGRFGYVVTGPNGNSIFLAAAGWRENTEFRQTIYYGRYWCSTVDEQNYYAYCLRFDDSVTGSSIQKRNLGFTVRPVTSNKVNDL